MNIFTQKSTIYLSVYTLLYLTAISLTFGFDHKVWVDEKHFYETIKLFTNHFSIETLRTYNEVIAPFTFIIYAIWGKVFGTDLATLRILSLLIALVTFFRFFVLAQKHFSPLYSLLLTILLSLNPYMIGISFFCYTDMLTILFSIEIALAIHSNSTFRFVIFSILSLYTRQYNVTVLMAVGIYYLLSKNENGKTNWFNAFSMFIPLIAFLPLIILWKGVAPDNQMHSLLNGYSYHYQLIALPTYIYTIVIYSLPLSLLWLYKNYQFRLLELLIVIAICSIFYALFPVTPAACSVHDGIYTVGLFHKVIDLVIKNSVLVHTILYLSFLFAVITLVDLIKKYKNYLFNYQPNQIHLFYLLNIITLLLVMPISYQIWEKYVLVIMPYCLILFGSFLDKKVV